MHLGQFAGRSEKGTNGSIRRTRIGDSDNASVTMCNLYSITTNQAAIAALFRVMNRYVGNLPPMPGVFPDYPAPVVRNAGTEREMVTMRWGMPDCRLVSQNLRKVLLILISCVTIDSDGNRIAHVIRNAGHFQVKSSP